MRAPWTRTGIVLLFVSLALGSQLAGQDAVRQQLQLRQLRERLAEAKQRYERLVRLRVAYSLLLDVSEAEIVAGTKPADMSRRAEIERELAELARTSQNLTLRLASLRESAKLDPSIRAHGSRIGPAPGGPGIVGADRSTATTKVEPGDASASAANNARSKTPTGAGAASGELGWGPLALSKLDHAPLRETPSVFDPLSSVQDGGPITYLAPSPSAFKRALALQRAGMPRQSLIVVTAALKEGYEPSLAFLRARALEQAGLTSEARSAYDALANPAKDADGPPEGSPWIEAAKSAIKHIDWLTSLDQAPLPSLEGLDW